MQLVIIGGSGNVGTALLRLLQTQARHTVTGVSRRRPPWVAPYDIQHWETLDIAETASVSRLTRVFAGADAVINLSWGFQPARDVDYLAAVGVGGLRHVLQAVSAAGVGHLVQMSSVGAYSAGSYGREVLESWPTDGIPTSPYSVQKAAAERVLDEYEATHPHVVISRPRPGLVMNGDAGSSLLRYAMPALVPARAVGWLPLLPLDRRFRVPIVQVDDVAAALLAMVERRAGGPFNLSAPDPLTPELLGEALDATPVHVPSAALRAVVAAGFHLHVQRLDPGWIDLAFSTPLMNTDHARALLDWRPVHSAADAVQELVDGMQRAAGTASPVLRPRSVPAEMLDLRRGPATRRRLP